MLFNSYVFIFGFLPLCLTGFFAFTRVNRRWAKAFLTIASFIFYGWWNIQYVPLLAGSIIFNYWVGTLIRAAVVNKRSKEIAIWRAFGVTANVALLGYFKYSNFLVDNVNFAFGTDLHVHNIILPLGISFFTFQKIAYLIDSGRGQVNQIDFIGFALFASFFPQLISGPIVRYDEVYPQFNTRYFILTDSHLLIGIAIFAIGLFKKTVIADTAGSIANPIYDAAAHHVSVGPVSGWIAAAAFTIQVYFDFSGYSDMAIGLARMFGIRLPLNFHSPLRAASIIDYWRRWHMTLTRFMVSYLYQPLSLAFTRRAIQAGLSRWPTFAISVAIPAFITFVVVGIWHGAGWTFVLYGVIHASYVCLNEAWREYQKHQRRKSKNSSNETKPSALTRVFYQLLTLFCVVSSNVMFRSINVATASHIYKGMFGFFGDPDAAAKTIDVTLAMMFIFGSFLIIAVMPNTQQIMRRYRSAVNWRQWRDVAPSLIMWRWRPNLIGTLFVGTVLFLGLAFIQRGEAVFLYFNF